MILYKKRMLIQAQHNNNLSRLDRDYDFIKNILVVRQHNQIGDMISSLPLYAALKKKFPASKITLASAKTNYPIPFFDINPYLDKVITFDKSKLKKVIKFLIELRKEDYQIGIVPSTIKLSRTSHIINYLSGAKIRVGVERIDDEINSSKYLLNIKSSFKWNSENVHQSKRNLDVIKQIGCLLCEEEQNMIGIELNDEDLIFAELLINKDFPDRDRLIIGIHPGAGKEKNIWEMPNFLELIQKLYNKYKPYFIITSGSTDKNIAKELKEILFLTGIEILLLDNLPVKKLAAVLSKVDLYITNDTGTMHIAGASGVNLISLFGPTKNLEWAPLGKNKFSIQSKSENINDITVDEVFEMSISILNKINRSAAIKVEA